MHRRKFHYVSYTFSLSFVLHNTISLLILFLRFSRFIWIRFVFEFRKRKIETTERPEQERLEKRQPNVLITKKNEQFNQKKKKFIRVTFKSFVSHNICCCFFCRFNSNCFLFSSTSPMNRTRTCVFVFVSIILLLSSCHCDIAE